ncbi:MAG: NAD-dependent epimerase/dehydratase family protein [Candidatus Woesearchaeota archaeon]
MEKGWILVTGGAGFIGSNLCELLEEKSLDVVVADDFSKGSTKNLVDFGGIVKRVDITDANQVKRLFRKYDFSHVIHLAAFTSLQDSMIQPEKEVTTNVLGTINITKAAGDSGVERLVFSSSAAVYGNPETSPVTEEHPTEPESIYGISKLAGEKYIRLLLSGRSEYVILRFGNVYGKRQEVDLGGEGGVIPVFIHRIENNLPVELRGYGKAVRDYVNVRDIAEGIYLALDAPQGTYNLATKKGTDIETVWDTLAGCFGDRKLPTAEKTALLHGEIEKMILSSDKAEYVMKWGPKVDFKDGIKQTVDWYFNQKVDS